MKWTVTTHENSNTSARDILQCAELGLTKDPIIVFNVEIDNSIVLQRDVFDKLDFAIDCAFHDEVQPLFAQWESEVAA